jgi:hypothetical protein
MHMQCHMSHAHAQPHVHMHMHMHMHMPCAHVHMCTYVHMDMHMHNVHVVVHVHMLSRHVSRVWGLESSAENSHHKRGKPTVPANAAVHRTQKSARAPHHGPTNKQSRSTRWKSPKYAAAPPTRRRIMRRMRVALRRPWRGPPSGCRVVRRGRPAASRTTTWRRRAACRCSRCRRWGCPCRRSSPSPSSA